MRLPLQMQAVSRTPTPASLNDTIRPSGCNILQCGAAVVTCGALFASGNIAGGIACLASNGYASCRDCFPH